MPLFETIISFDDIEPQDKIIDRDELQRITKLTLVYRSVTVEYTVKWAPDSVQNEVTDLVRVVYDTA